MSHKFIMLIAGLMLSISGFAQELSAKSFSNHFSLLKNAEGKVTAIRLKRAVSHFTIMPFIEQIKNDLLGEQHSLINNEAEIDEMLEEMGLNPYLKANGSEEAQHFKDALLAIKQIDVNSAFTELNKTDFWKQFEAKLNEAFLFIDPTILTNHEDARFFYKRAVTYKVVTWALEEVKKRFSSVPILNIASFVIVRVHDMMLEQRHFHHNMLLHYFENVPETELGMTKEEVDRAVSSIYEYRIEATNIFESNRAARDWLNYGMNNFYVLVRAGNTKVREWASPFSTLNFQDVKKINFAFSEVTQDGARKIYHLHVNAHQFSRRPALAYDYSHPSKVKRMRSLINLGNVALGFLNLPGWVKSNVETFLHSLYVEQVRMEGALVGYFETHGNQDMLKAIYGQRANFYILQ